MDKKKEEDNKKFEFAKERKKERKKPNEKSKKMREK